MSIEPSSIRIKMYQVGFGDCFLVTLGYSTTLDDGRDRRNILIDFGSTKLPEGSGGLGDVASLIAADCDGILDVLVVTHRHKDHLSGFGSAGPASSIDTLDPKLVVRSWTEDPTAAPDATGITSAGFIARLGLGQEFAAGVVAQTQGAAGNSAKGKLARLALDQLSNADAVNQLNLWAARGEGSYVSYGAPSRVEEFVPGVHVSVLGPPTLEQHPNIARQRDVDPDEFWMLYQSLFDAASSEGWANPILESADGSAEATPLGPVRWLVDHLDRQRVSSVLRIVRILDDVLNNTSVILLVEVGNKRMLFPGDAQIENWEYALKFAPDASATLDLLRGVDVYKVGHHGSRNATPRTLFNLWNDATPKRPMTGLLSTLSGVHGETEETKVPRSTLVAALNELTALHSTEDLAAGVPAFEIEGDPSDNGSFETVGLS